MSDSRPNPEHPAWQSVCPFSNMTHEMCNVGDAPDGMSPRHLQWHINRFVEIGEWEIVGGADDPDQVRYKLKDK